MRQLNVIEIDNKDRDIEYNECRNIFDTYDIIWGGQWDDDEIGWQTESKEKIKKYYDASKNLRNFLIEIKQDVSLIDRIVVDYI